MEFGVAIVNDPSALTFDHELARVVAQCDAGFILNHMRGTPETWAKLPPLKDVAGTVAADLGACVHRATQSGVTRARIVIDPGLGFGKRREQNTEILAQLSRLAELDLPILVGPSRKSFLAQPTEKQTEMATAAAVTAAILGGVHIVRVHDIEAIKPVVQVADAVLAASL
jgi:dihydropteroate synthase